MNISKIQWFFARWATLMADWYTAAVNDTQHPSHWCTAVSIQGHEYWSRTKMYRAQQNPKVDNFFLQKQMIWMKLLTLYWQWPIVPLEALGENVFDSFSAVFHTFFALFLFHFTLFHLNRVTFGDHIQLRMNTSAFNWLLRAGGVSYRYWECVFWHLNSPPLSALRSIREKYFSTISSISSITKKSVTIFRHQCIWWKDNI